ncbi:MAG: hypothetical protein AABX19_03535 [Nanoarchaeota archaeon]
MDHLQLREKEIFQTLKALKNFNFIIIGGYAVNSYALPRFSIDCDIVIKEKCELEKIEEELIKIGYIKVVADDIDIPYHGSFYRYEKTLENKFKASIDILFKEILDRQTNSRFSAEWVFENSSIQKLKGKTITEELKVKIIDTDALIVMKMISCRSTDIRDVFMIITQMKDSEWIKKEIKERCNLIERLKKLQDKISSEKFKNDLQGVYGYIDEKIFNKHKKMILEMKED